MNPCALCCHRSSLVSLACAPWPRLCVVPFVWQMPETSRGLLKKRRKLGDPASAQVSNHIPYVWSLPHFYLALGGQNRIPSRSATLARHECASRVGLSGVATAPGSPARSKPPWVGSRGKPQLRGRPQVQANDTLQHPRNNLLGLITPTGPRYRNMALALESPRVRGTRMRHESSPACSAGLCGPRRGKAGSRRSVSAFRLSASCLHSFVHRAFLGTPMCDKPSNLCIGKGARDSRAVTSARKRLWLSGRVGTSQRSRNKSVAPQLLFAGSGIGESLLAHEEPRVEPPTWRLRPGTLEMERSSRSSVLLGKERAAPERVRLHVVRAQLSTLCLNQWKSLPVSNVIMFSSRSQLRYFEIGRRRSAT